jgi:putative acetyltransferase
MLEIRPEPPRQPEVEALLAASDAFSMALYPPESNHLVDVATLEQPGVTFLVARLAGRAVGCGAVVAKGAGWGEIKRMYVDEAARGTGAGAQLLARLEHEARARGLAVLRLETGIHNHAALKLYRRFGYAKRPPFGDYAEDPLSIFMERTLAQEPAR